MTTNADLDGRRRDHNRLPTIKPIERLPRMMGNRKHSDVIRLEAIVERKCPFCIRLHDHRSNRTLGNRRRLGMRTDSIDRRPHITRKLEALARIKRFEVSHCLVKLPSREWVKLNSKHYFPYRDSILSNTLSPGMP